LIEYQLTIGSQSADTLIKALIDRLVGNPYETQDLEILSMLLCGEIQKCSYKIIGTEVQKRFFTDYIEYLHGCWITVKQ